MNANTEEFSGLCGAVVEGDPESIERFRRMLLPCLRAIVRRRLREEFSGRPGNDRNRGAECKASCVGPCEAPWRDETRVNQAAQRQCEEIINSLVAEQAPLPYETICDCLHAASIRMQAPRGPPSS
jgi:hypothetical protein